MSEQNKALDILCSNYDKPLPQGLEFVYKYFNKDSDRYIIQYYYYFGNIKSVHLAGHFSSRRRGRFVVERFKKILKIRDKLRADFNFEELARLESGNYLIQEIKNIG